MTSSDRAPEVELRDLPPLDAADHVYAALLLRHLGRDPTPGEVVALRHSVRAEVERRRQRAVRGAVERRASLPGRVVMRSPSGDAIVLDILADPLMLATVHGAWLLVDAAMWSAAAVARAAELDVADRRTWGPPLPLAPWTALARGHLGYLESSLGREPEWAWLYPGWRQSVPWLPRPVLALIAASHRGQVERQREEVAKLLRGSGPPYAHALRRWEREGEPVLAAYPHLGYPRSGPPLGLLPLPEKEPEPEASPPVRWPPYAPGGRSGDP